MDGYISYPRTDNTVYPKPRSTPGAGQRAGRGRRLQGGRVPARRAAGGDPRARRRRPTTRRSTRPRRSTRSGSRPARRPTAGSTSWSPGASSPPSRRRWSRESTRADIEGRLARTTSCAARSCSTPASPPSTPTRAPPTPRSRSSSEGQELDLEGERAGSARRPSRRPGSQPGQADRDDGGARPRAPRRRAPTSSRSSTTAATSTATRRSPRRPGSRCTRAFKKYVPRMATPDMTAEMEAEMDQIAAGEMTKDQVLVDSRDMLRSAYDEMGDDVGTRRRGRAPGASSPSEVWAGHGRGPDPGPLHRLPGGRPQAGGRLPEHAARSSRRRKSGKRFVGCQGWDGDDPDSPDSCDQTFPMPQPRFCGLTRSRRSARSAAARRALSVAQRFARAPLEALPQRRLPLDGGDEAPPRRARGREGGQGGGRLGGRRRRGGREPRRPSPEAEKIAGQASATKVKRAQERRRPLARQRLGLGRQAARGREACARAEPVARIACGRCSSPSRESTAPARPRRRAGSPRRSAPTPCSCASRAAPPPGSGSESCSRTRRWSWTRWPSCCSSAPRGRSSSPR